jgi:hypothetical protein
MDTSVHRARLGLVGAKTRQGLTEAKLREMQPGERAYKVSDGGNGLYVVVSPSGSRSFRYDYRPGGRREPLTVGRHEPVARHAQRSHLAYGMDVTLEEARLLLARARVDVSSGRSPARAKVEECSEIADAMSSGGGRRGTSSSSQTPRAVPSGCSARLSRPRSELLLPARSSTGAGWITPLITRLTGAEARPGLAEPAPGYDLKPTAW